MNPAFSCRGRKLLFFFPEASWLLVSFSSEASVAPATARLVGGTLSLT